MLHAATHQAVQASRRDRRDGDHCVHVLLVLLVAAVRQLVVSSVVLLMVLLLVQLRCVHLLVQVWRMDLLVVRLGVSVRMGHLVMLLVVCMVVVDVGRVDVVVVVRVGFLVGVCVAIIKR
jgi:hypothetical protein